MDEISLDNSFAEDNQTNEMIVEEAALPTPLGVESTVASVDTTMPYSPKDFLPDHETWVNLEADINTSFAYVVAIQKTQWRPIVRSITITNAGKEDLTDLTVWVWADVDLIDCYSEKISYIEAGKEYFMRPEKIRMHGEYPASLTEETTCNIYVSVTRGDKELAKISENITIYAYNQWPGLAYTPELLSAFVTPNFRIISVLLQSATEYMGKWTGNPSLGGYQADVNRVYMMAAAAYAAIQKKNIVYSNPPASFGVGQRIRMVDEVINTRLGTCMDMSLLYASVLEAMGLNPILILQKSHIFVGVWLVEENDFPGQVTDDPTQIEKRLAEENKTIEVVECTAMCAGQGCSFEFANKKAAESLAVHEEFLFAIDVKRCRDGEILPIPVRVQSSEAYTVEEKDLSDDEVTSAPTASIVTLNPADLIFEKKPLTKKEQWERKLLDLSLRNTLINMRLNRSVVPLLVADLAEFEDALADGAEFTLFQRPKEWEDHKIEVANSETINDLGPYRELIHSEQQQKKIHSWLQDKPLMKAITQLYRSSKSAMEESGANTLYLTVGVLRWTDGPRAANKHYAPIVLIPVELVRKTGGFSYGIRKRDDDVQVNVTLLEFLKQNYEIEMAGLNPPPTDEHGIDILKVFAIIRHAIMNQAGWDIVENVFVGNFSFAQFAMWNDIHSHSDLLGRNKIVRALMSGVVDWNDTIPEETENEDAYLPVTVDASQLRAINLAANDVSFVLHGPPGTGKSQTITAMIANALTKGKTVLFVAEKKPALEVVKKRLEDLGIENFCLELHSDKAVKRNVLNQLKRGMDLRVWGFSTNYEQKIKEVHSMRQNLDSYVKELHERRNCGLSFRELLDEYEAIPEKKTSLRFTQSYAEAIGPEDLETRRKLLQRLVDAGVQVGHPKDSKLAIVGRSEYTQSFRLQLEDVLAEYEETINALQKAADEFTAAVGEPSPVTQEQWQEILNLSYGFARGELLPGFVLESANMDQLFRIPTQYVSMRDLYLNQRKTFLLRYQESILSVNLEDIARQYEAASKKLLGKKKAIDSVTAELQEHVKVPVTPEMLPVITAEVEQFRQTEASSRTAKEAVPEYWIPYLGENATLESLNDLRIGWEKQLDGMDRYLAIVSGLKAAGKYPDCLALAKQLSDATTALQSKECELYKLLQLNTYSYPSNWIEGKRLLVRLLGDHFDELREWITYCGVREECIANGLQDICRLYDEGLPHEDVIPVYFKAVYRALIRTIIEQKPVLNRFTGNTFNERIKEYKALEEEFISLTKEEMYYKLTHNLPTGHESAEINKELSILRRAIAGGGRNMSIRSLFDQIPHVLMKLCPCLLMSPSSVAQYLSVDYDPFDIVVFDEASQLPTCKAVGVLARGKNAVIVGDPNQMPPTSFFTGKITDEDSIDTEDMDSILQDCLALGMPQTHLLWHYRSRHESLIAFSNREYYENKMYTFPSVNEREKRVRLCTVNGIYDRKKGRVNEREGQAVVREILRRYNSPELNQYSIGVVTFNICQQGYIEDLLAEEFKKDTAFDQWANDRKDELFVKNLENVQGDERDVILFSVGFGPDEEGNLSMNFGPLNKEDGWKRLNVAVSRARMEMIVFSSMTPEMIDLNRTSAKGVEGLRAFLEYAGKGRLVNIDGAKSRGAQGITKQICETLTAAGYKVQKNLGHSSFKIDIAVVNPYDEDTYLLGVILDGDTYKQSENTKDREVSQIAVLNGLGWKLHRIWAMDWWDNKDKELKALMKVVEELKEAARIAAETPKYKNDEPKSEEITYQKKERKTRGGGGGKKKPEGNSSFEAVDRFERYETPAKDDVPGEELKY